LLGRSAENDRRRGRFRNATGKEGTPVSLVGIPISTVTTPAATIIDPNGAVLTPNGSQSFAGVNDAAIPKIAP
jgi:hypothetical protein